MNLEGVGLAAIVAVLVWVYAIFFRKNPRVEVIEQNAANLARDIEGQRGDQAVIREEEKVKLEELVARKQAKREQLERDRARLEAAKQKILEDFSEEELDESLVDLGIGTDVDAWQ